MKPSKAQDVQIFYRENRLSPFDLLLEGPQKRQLWATLELPEKITGPAIVMAHGFLGFKDWAFFPWLSSFFAQAGFPVLRFNFSGSGMGNAKDGPFQELENFEKDTITRQVEDLHVVVSRLEQGQLNPNLPPQKDLFLWGHSRGGGVCLLAAGQCPPVKGVATWATISRVNRYFFEAKQAWRKDGYSVIESSRTGQALRYSLDFLEDAENWGKEGDVPAYLNRLGIPVLFVHGSEDKSVLPDESESLAAIHSQSRLAILAGGDHKFMASHPFTQASPVLLEAAQATVKFFSELLD